MSTGRGLDVGRELARVEQRLAVVALVEDAGARPVVAACTIRKGSISRRRQEVVDDVHERGFRWTEAGGEEVAQGASDVDGDDGGYHGRDAGRPSWRLARRHEQPTPRSGRLTISWRPESG